MRQHIIAKATMYSNIIIVLTACPSSCFDSGAVAANKMELST